MHYIRGQTMHGFLCFTTELIYSPISKTCELGERVGEPGKPQGENGGKYGKKT